MSDHSFNPFIAEKYGINEAIFIQNMIFWTRTNSAKDNNHHEERYWCFGTPDYFSKYFPYFKTRLIKDIINSCLKLGLLIKGNFNKKGYDRTNWFSLSDKMLIELNLDRTCLQPWPGLIVRKTSNALDEKRPMDRTENVQPIPDTKPDTKPLKDTTTSSSSFFEHYQDQEKEKLDFAHIEFTKQQMAEKFRRESLGDEQCLGVYKDRFRGLNVTLEELYEECVDYWSQTDQQVYKARFLGHLKKAPLDKYKDFQNIKSKSSITPDEKTLIQNYLSLCKAHRKPSLELDTKISQLRANLKMTDTAEAREALAILNKADEIASCAQFTEIITESKKKMELSLVGKSTLSNLRAILK